jgi:hypothetical protein
VNRMMKLDRRQRGQVRTRPRSGCTAAELSRAAPLSTAVEKLTRASRRAGAARARRGLGPDVTKQ